MELTVMDSKLYLKVTVPNVTQPGLTVDLLVRTSMEEDLHQRTEKVANYMVEQCNQLIPLFYEMRNEMPRGRVRQMLSQHAKNHHDDDLKAYYLDLTQSPDFEYRDLIPLKSITVDGTRVSMIFTSKIEPDHVFFSKTLEIPFHDPALWAEVELHHKARLVEECLAAEKATGRAINEDMERQFESNCGMASSF